MTGMKESREKEKVPIKEAGRFSKEQLLSSGRFRERRDIVEALLDGKELYSTETVEEKIRSYMKGKVK